jgi:hypothetical protein
VRFGLLLICLLSALAATPAAAQEPTPAPDPCATPDADYVYTDNEYAYCTDALPTGTAPPRRKRAPEVVALPAAARLPVTGSEPLLIALAGLGLLLAGSGLRLTNAGSTDSRGA